MENAGVCQGAIAFFAVSPLFACFACFFFYFTCLFVLFSHLNHTGVVNAVDLTIRVAGMLDLFLHVFVDNQSKRRLFKF